MSRRSPRRLVAVVAVALGIAALAPAATAEAKTSVKPPAKSVTAPVVVTPLDWWF